MTSSPTSRPRWRRFHFAPVAVVGLLVLVAVVGAGCGSSTSVPPVNVQRPPEPQKPAATNLTTPEDAVRTYLDYVTYAYRLGRSDVASQAMAPEEFARVDSYIRYDRSQQRAIEQRLQSISFGASVPGTRTADSTATAMLLPAHETWTYRYIDLTTGGYKGAAKSATLDATYTLVPLSAVSVPWKTPGHPGWLVAAVEATAAAKAK